MILITIYILLALCWWVLAWQFTCEYWAKGFKLDIFDRYMAGFFALLSAVIWPMFAVSGILVWTAQKILDRKK